MNIQDYFSQKKQRLMAFFDHFHQIIDEIKRACNTEIDNQSIVAYQVLKNTQLQQVHHQCSQMLLREPQTLTRIVDRIATLIKTQIIQSSTCLPKIQEKQNSSLEQIRPKTISLGKFERQKSAEKFKTPIKGYEDKVVAVTGHRNVIMSSSHVGMPLLHRQNHKYSSQGGEHGQNRLLQTPVNQYTAEYQSQKRLSHEQNIISSGRIDKTIQQEAIYLLTKTKKPRSPSRMRNSSLPKQKSFIARGDLQADGLIRQNLERRYA